MRGEDNELDPAAASCHMTLESSAQLQVSCVASFYWNNHKINNLSNTKNGFHSFYCFLVLMCVEKDDDACDVQIFLLAVQIWWWWGASCRSPCFTSSVQWCTGECSRYVNKYFFQSRLTSSRQVNENSFNISYFEWSRGKNHHASWHSHVFLSLKSNPLFFRYRMRTSLYEFQMLLQTLVKSE